MNIRGLFKTSLVDFPGRISAVVFTGGCNLRCGYCHNPGLALNSPDIERIKDETVLSFLEKRKGLIDGVTVSGGEPALDPGLVPFLRKIRSMGLRIKLDTNGFFPEILNDCIQSGLADYVALDIKTSPDMYSSLTGKDVSFNRILETLDVLRQAQIDHEIRTTCVPGFVTVETIRKIGLAAGKINKYFLQQFVNSSDLLDPAMRKLTPYTVDYLNKLRDEALKFSRNCTIRGI
jgi:pyruvate formate lyase activating enzyme